MTQTVCTQEDGWLLWNNDAKFNWMEWKCCLDLVYILDKAQKEYKWKKNNRYICIEC